MTLSFLFWFLLLVWILFGGWVSFAPNPNPRWIAGSTLVLLLLLIVVGLKLFGSPLAGH